MEDFYNDLVKEFKTFMKENYNETINVLKKAPLQIAKFPTIDLIMNDTYIYSTTLRNKEYYEQCYFTINVYNKSTDSDVTDDLTKQINAFFMNIKGMKKNGQKPIDNIDNQITRIRIDYECKVGNLNRQIRI